MRLVGMFREVGAQMDARWPKLGPSWRQVASKMGHDGAKMGHDNANMGHDSVKMACRAQLGSFWVSSGNIFRGFRRWAGKRKK